MSDFSSKHFCEFAGIVNKGMRGWFRCLYFFFILLGYFELQGPLSDTQA